MEPACQQAHVNVGFHMIPGWCHMLMLSLSPPSFRWLGGSWLASPRWQLHPADDIPRETSDIPGVHSLFGCLVWSQVTRVPKQLQK